MFILLGHPVSVLLHIVLCGCFAPSSAPLSLSLSFPREEWGQQVGLQLWWWVSNFSDVWWEYMEVSDIVVGWEAIIIMTSERHARGG